MRILKNKLFHRWSMELGLSNDCLLKAIDEMTQGLYEANLGGNIFKKRVAMGNQGKRSGVRTIVAFKTQGMAIFTYGFAKNKKDNITQKEEDELKALAKTYFSYNESQINLAIKAGKFIEVSYEKINL